MNPDNFAHGGAGINDIDVTITDAATCHFDWGGQAPIDRLGLERRGGIHWLMFIANILSIEYTA